MEHFTSIHPYTGDPVAVYPLMSSNQVSLALSQAQWAYPEWSSSGFAERGRVLREVARLLREDKDTYAELITMEMGKIIGEARGEVEKSAWVCDYYADNAETFLQPEIIEAGYRKSLVRYEPVGAVLGIMPWNFPFWQVFRYAAPTLMAGNVTLLKHAPNVSGCSLAIAALFQKAGAPEGVFQSLIIDIPLLQMVMESGIVQAATLTGSERAGASLAALAGSQIKKTVLELGGSDPLIVLADADISQAVATAIQSRFLNAGQSCIGAKRFIVIAQVYQAFLEALQAGMDNLRTGDPRDPLTTTAPVARPDLAENLRRQWQASVQRGARLVRGGEVTGCRIKPGLLLDAVPGMPAFDEETFGPLAVLTRAADEEEAVKLANASTYGLAASIWTRDEEKGLALAGKIQSGAVFINSLVKSDPRLPFGGIKKSGYGRELGKSGIHEFVNVKTVALGPER
ncbi:NAD-dependent succinate-semialdehyde dehydrogenase [Flavihumibacter petaseus]|uniref:Succinate-semialdehyde dehydrogenase n=1 Tax=Flavihumibacter petaseus NBRC 106054 TaxID=1220578 RepID=A0A0E9MWF2_9BACT|nr:NAD-dependent succinate-semialdehyde dehydrogenase [Flavihumibacter petaseus]GAO42067.1 succinate-semialdehyde dehydrogenase [Flavihumibacter petaseus NBRC 106054]